MSEPGPERKRGDSRPELQVTVVSACYNEAESLPQLLLELLSIADALPGIRFRIVMVDDGSEDDSVAVLREASRRDRRIEVHPLSRNFGHQVALSAGLDLAQGDAVVMLDSDLQHPPHLIPRMIELWQEGHDIVSAVRDDTEDASFAKRLTSRAFYALVRRMTDREIVPGAADFCLLARPAYLALRRMPERHRFLRGMVAWIGFRRTYLHYRAAPRRHGRSKYTPWKMLRLALDGIFSFTVWPLRLIGQVGLMTSLLGLGYLGYVLFQFVFRGDTVRGWPSLISTVLILGGLQLLALGAVGEYLARVYEESKGRPLYLFKERDDLVAPAESPLPSELGRPPTKPAS
jgi:polyisoprenyl-phosphate glycosyltransferase